MLKGKSQKKAKGTAKTKTTRHRVMFSLEAPEAREVAVTGDFNKWDPKMHPMKRDDSGRWQKAVLLEPGRIEYKFVVDGNWQCDPRNDQLCSNSFGSQNNVLVLS